MIPGARAIAIVPPMHCQWKWGDNGVYDDNDDDNDNANRE
jgi:hypothetical protein